MNFNAQYMERKNDMTGISTSCFYPMQTEESLLTLAQSGVKTVEIFFNSQSETRGGILDELLRIRDEYSLHINSVHPYFTFAEKTLLFSQYERRIEDGMEFYRGLFDACDALGSKILVLHGDYNPLRISDEEYIARFERLVREANDRGLTVSQENVVNYRSQSVDFLKKEREALGDLFKMTFDVKQAVRSSIDPLYLANEFKESIVNVHISDHTKERDCIPPTDGDFSFEKLFGILNGVGYDGNYIIELYRQGFENTEQLIESYKKVTKIYETSCKN